jgi:DNA-binding NtrC family response regulator
MDLMVNEGNIREDFYYRLNVINIHMPPLRERKEDIPLLSEYFLNNILRSSPKEITGFKNDAMDALISHQWPGNVRELENAIERAVALSRSDKILIRDLPNEFQINTIEGKQSIEGLTLAEAKQLAIEKVEKDYLFQLLKKHSGNITRIATDSGMTRRNIHRLIKRYELDPNIWR